MRANSSQAGARHGTADTSRGPHRVLTDETIMGVLLDNRFRIAESVYGQNRSPEEYAEQQIRRAHEHINSAKRTLSEKLWPAAKAVLDRPALNSEQEIGSYVTSFGSASLVAAAPP